MAVRMSGRTLVTLRSLDGATHELVITDPDVNECRAIPLSEDALVGLHWATADAMMRAHYSRRRSADQPLDNSIGQHEAAAE